MKKLDTGINYTRYAVGELTVVALRDGHIDMAASRLRREGNRSFESELPLQVELIEGKLRLSVNAFLVIERDQLILIDTGAANSLEPCYGPSMGLLLQALNEAGVAREKIETVAFTHTHEDHVNGLVTADGSDAFSNLQRLFVPKEEVSLFDNNERLSRFRARRTPIENGFKLSSSITAIEAFGHEVGHTAYEVSSGDESLLIWGDIVHVQSIQFARPELTWEYDANQDDARACRQRMFRRAIQPNSYVAGAHLAYPGVGAVTEYKDTYIYTPV